MLWEAIFPENGEAIESLRPALDGMPLLGNIAESQIQQLYGRFLVGERAACLDDLPQGHIQRLYRVGGVDDLADLGRKREERNDLLPVPPPKLTNRTVLAVPDGFERGELSLGFLPGWPPGKSVSGPRSRRGLLSSSRSGGWLGLNGQCKVARSFLGKPFQSPGESLSIRPRRR